MNEYIDLFYPVKRWWHAEGDQGNWQKLGTETSFGYLRGSCFTSWPKNQKFHQGLHIPIWRDNNIYRLDQSK